MDSENQTNINSIGEVGELNAQSGESLTKTSIPINENVGGDVNQELDTNQLPIQKNITYNKYELKPKKQKKRLYFLLGVLVGILLCLCYSLLSNNNGISKSITDTINSLSNKIGTLNNTVNSIDKSKLSGTYATDNSKYVIDFNKDGTLRRTEKYMGQGMFEDHTSFYVGTYEYDNNVYTLYVEGGTRAVNTVFTATPQSDGSLRIVGGTVHDELFRKKS